MPAGLVHDHDDELLGVALRDLGEEHRHRLGAHPGQHQAVEDSVVWADRGERVQVPALQARADDRATAMRRPATPWCAQQSEAALVLEHQPHPAAGFSLARDLAVYLAAQFF
jgi:hypothetical protein